jgi:hypothetical protein
MIDAHELHGLGRDLATAGLLAQSRAALVVHDTIEAVASTGRANAPRGRTGHLADSVGYDVADDGLSAEAGPTAWYGHFPEGGTVRSAPEPYMGPALDAHDGPFTEGIARIGSRVWLG